MNGRPGTVVTVPTLGTRTDVRRISQHVSDLAGVLALTVDVETRTVTVEGDITFDQVRAAITAAGHEVDRPDAGALGVG